MNDVTRGPFSIPPIAAFSPDYATARQRFRAAAARLGWELEAHPIGGTGPSGEILTIDVALSARLGATQVLVVSSGLHGVEGFFGSALQLGLLEHWYRHPESKPAVRCVFLHALNPYGFAWLRRVDAQNIDPNRNFLLADEPYAGCPDDYRTLDPLLNPRQPPAFWEPFMLKALLTIARHGLPTLRQTVAGGQYVNPHGLFYGGAGPSTAHKLLAQHLGRWLQDCGQVTHLDLHTGLGSWARYRLLLDYPPNAAQRNRLTRWVGAAAWQTDSAPGTAYRTRGSLGRWCVARQQQQDYLYACAEFGTYHPLRVLAGLRAENQAYHWGRPGDRATRRAKRRLRELFCPVSASWRQHAIRHGFDLVAGVLRGMATPTARVGCSER